jgi:hypothetical protein
MESFETCLTLQEPLIVERDTLGETFTANIGDCDVILGLPQDAENRCPETPDFVGIFGPELAISKDNNPPSPLDPPPNSSNEKVVYSNKFGEKKVLETWGELFVNTDEPVKNDRIYAAVYALQITGEQEIDDISEFTENFAEELLTWEERIYDAKLICTYPEIGSSLKGRYFSNRKNNYFYFDSGEQGVTGGWSLLYDFESLSKEDLENVFKYASQETKPFLAHDLLCDAYQSFYKEEFRRAVYEAGMALEAILNEQLYSVISEIQKIEDPLKFIKNYAQGLGSKLQMLDHLNENNFATDKNDLDNNLISARNRVVHTGFVPDETETYEALNTARYVLFNYQSNRFADYDLQVAEVG